MKHETRMIAVSAILSSSFAILHTSFALAANQTYYVDAQNGNDGWSGTADYAHRDEANKIGPIQTLANITNLVKATSKASTVGDTVYLAEGDYKTGSTYDGLNRASLPAGTRLIGVGDRSRIRIFGSATDEKQTASAGNTMRCLSIGKWVLVKNITLCNGRLYGANGGAATVGTDSYLVGCVISNNYVVLANSKGGRGGAMSGGTAIRCLFTKNGTSYIASCINTGTAWNSVFDGNWGTYPIYQGAAHSCTFIGGSALHDTYYHDNYNLLCRVSADVSSASLYYWHSLFTCSIAESRLKEGSRADLSANDLQFRADYMPVYGANLGIDSGTNEAYEANFPTSKLVSDQKDLDFNGKPRIVNGRIDVGACECDPDGRTLTIADAQTGLTVTGANKGTTFLSRGETNTFTLARNYSTAKLLTGVRVNGEFLSFTGEDADRTYEYVYGYGNSVTSLVIEAVYATHNDFYVTANEDPAKGFVGNDANNGYTKYQAKKTLAGAMAIEALASGDTVHAAAGVYGEGEMASDSFTNRVVVKAGVGLVADEGKDATAIEGYIPPAAQWGTLAPIRCVKMDDGAYIRGFTIRKGMAAMEQVVSGKKAYGQTGGGVNGGTAIDCVITNCYAVRGGGVGGSAVLIRCIVKNNSTYSATSTQGGSTSATAANVYYSGDVFDSYVQDATVIERGVNSHFGKLNHNESKSLYVYNSYLDSSPSTVYLYNSVASGNVGATYLREGSSANTKLKFDKNMRPDRTDPTTAAYAIDRGSRTFYDEYFPSGFASTDIAGGQRVYNGQIDIGPGEYDWRGDFAGELSPKTRVSVAEASAGVTTNAVAGLDLTDGDTLTVRYDLRKAGTCRLTVAAAEGDVTVTCGGEPLVPVGNLYSFEGQAGTNDLVVTYAGDGTATVSAALLPNNGFVMLLR